MKKELRISSKTGEIKYGKVETPVSISVSRYGKMEVSVSVPENK